MTAAPATTEPLTQEEQDAADALWKAVAAGATLYALLRMSDRRKRLTIERMIIRSERILVDIGIQLRDGVITLAQWVRQVQQQLRPLHLAAVAATVGGFPLLTQAHVSAYRQALSDQFAFLATFRQQLRSAAQLLDGTFLARLRMYARAAHGVAQEVNRKVQPFLGKTEERRVLGVADHCPDCPPLAARGWQPIGSLPKIGATVCRVNCRCHWEYR